MTGGPYCAAGSGCWSPRRSPIRRYLRQGEHAYIIGEKLRSDSAEIKAALSRQGRYTEIGENMRVKEVKVSETERFVI